MQFYKINKFLYLLYFSSILFYFYVGPGAEEIEEWIENNEHS